VSFNLELTRFNWIELQHLCSRNLPFLLLSAEELRGTLFPGYCMFEVLSLKDYREDNLFTNRDCTRQVPSIVELSKDSLFEERSRIN
jgi:hypothetical protein